MATATRGAHDVLNTSDHLLDISSEHSLTHHPSLISAYESELQFDESTFQHETEPYRSQVADSLDLNETDLDGTSGEHHMTQSDRGDDDDNIKIKADDMGVFSSSPVGGAALSPGSTDDDEEDNENPYSSYQQFHKELSNQDDPKSELMEFETLEQELEGVLATVTVPDRSDFLTHLTAAGSDDLSTYDSLKQYLGRVPLPGVTDDSVSESLTRNSKDYALLTVAWNPAELGVTVPTKEHRSRRDDWKGAGADKPISNEKTSRTNTKPQQGGTKSPSRIPMMNSGSRPVTPRTPRGSAPVSPVRLSPVRSKTPTNIPTLRKSKSQSLNRTRHRYTPDGKVASPRDTPRPQRPRTIAGGYVSPSLNRSGELRPSSGRRSASADTKRGNQPRRTMIPSPTMGKRPHSMERRQLPDISGSRIPRSRPMTPSSSMRSLDRQSSPEPRSELSEATSSRPASRLPKRSKSGLIGKTQNGSRSSVEPRKFQNHATKPSRLPSARPSVTSATELTSQDEHSPELDLSSDDSHSADIPLKIPNETSQYPPVPPPHNSMLFRNPPSSDTQPLSTLIDTQDQITSLTDKSATEVPPLSPKSKPTKITKTTYDYEEIETTKTTTRILTQLSPKADSARKTPSSDKSATSPGGEKARSRSHGVTGSRFRQGSAAAENRAVSEDRKDSPSQFREARALNDAIKILEGRESKDKTPSQHTEKSSWSPTIPDEIGDNSRPMSSTWTSLADYNNSGRDTKANSTLNTTMIKVENTVSPRNRLKSEQGEDMPRKEHTHLPGAVNHAHYALPTTSYLKKGKPGSKESRYRHTDFGRQDSSSSEPAPDAKRRPRREKPASPPKADQSEAADVSKRGEETESEELVRQLQTDFDDLLSKYAMAEVTIDQLRLGAKLNLYSDPVQPGQAVHVQPSTARSATTLSIPQKGQGSLNSSLQSAQMGFILPTTSSPRQPAEAGILTTAKPMTEPQRALAENIVHLQDQVASFIAGVSGEGRVLNLKPEIHHQLYEALEQSQDTLHHQLTEEKQQDPDFDIENALAGQLHQIRMSMDDHIDQLPQIQQPPRAAAPKVHSSQWHSDEESLTHTPSSRASTHSNSTSIQRPKKSSGKQGRRSNNGSRKGTPQGSRGSRSYTEHTSSSEADTDNESIKRRGSRDGKLKPKNKPGAASTSSIAGSDNPVTHGLKSRTRLGLQGSSDSGFIGSEEGKSPNTPSDRHISGLPTIQSQAENSGVDSPRVLTPDLSEERTAEWALRHKIEVESSEPTLPEPPKSKRTGSRSSRKSARSERSGQSSLKSEALRSIKTEIEKLRDEFNTSSHSVSPERDADFHDPHANMPKHSYGSPMKATYKLPSDYQSPTSRPHTRSNRQPADVRNSDLDLSEVEGGRGYTPAPPPASNRRRPTDYPSTDEDPRQPPRRRPLQGDPSQQYTDSDYAEQRTLQQKSPHGQPRPDTVDMAHQRDRPMMSSSPSGRGRDQREPEYERRRGKSPHGDRRPASPFDPRDVTPTSERRRGDREYRDSPSRGSSYYNDQYQSRHPEDPHSLEYKSPLRAHPDDYRSPGRKQDRPSSVRSQRSNDSRGRRGQRSGYRDGMSPISERAYEGPEAEYYRQYKSPLRSRTMEELGVHDLNQTTIPFDSTVHTHQTRSPNVAPPNANSTPHRSYQPAPQQQSAMSYPQAQQYGSQTHPTQQQYSGQSHGPVHQYTSQSQPPMQQTYTQQPQQRPMGQSHPVYHQPLQQTVPVQQVPVHPPVYQQPVGVTSYPVQQTMAMTSLPVQQLAPVAPTVHIQTANPTVASSFRACPSCSGRGVQATAHHCTACGSQVQLANQIAAMQVTTPTTLRVTNQATPVVIPVANQKQGEAYLTQQTADGGYVTQNVDVVQSGHVQPTATLISSSAVPVVETSPSGKVRYYVREYGPVTSDAEPHRSRSSSRRSHKSRDKHRHSIAAESMDELETSLRDAFRSAESLKRISRDMREGLTQELTRSANHRRSLTSSWNL